jgi:S1-C subfamily serine protease
MANPRRLALFVLASIGALSASEARGQAPDWPWLGVIISDITAYEGKGRGSSNSGSFVTSVEQPGPASAAGVLRHDIIVGIDGRPAGNTRELTCLIQSRRPGDVVRVMVMRSGQQRVITARLGRWPENNNFPQPRRSDCGRDKVSAR